MSYKQKQILRKIDIFIIFYFIKFNLFEFNNILDRGY